MPIHQPATAPQMRRLSNRTFVCEDYPDFQPNVSPSEMFNAGVFGGTYFRDIKIGSTWYKNAWKEFKPYGWFDSIDIKTQIASQSYDASQNKYGVKCGQSLQEWLDKGWIKTDYDSHGWVHWYCRFFLGRRCDDDARQIARWRACAGEKGRWKRNLIAKCVKAGKTFDDESVSPVVRQLLLHWGYQLTEHHFNEYKKLLERGHRTSFVSQSDMEHVVKVKDENVREEDDREKRRKEESDAREQRRRKRARQR